MESCSFDGAVAYREGVLSEAEPLVSLYFAKTADFVEKTGGMTTLEAEDLIRERAGVFLEEKDYLLERW